MTEKESIIVDESIQDRIDKLFKQAGQNSIMNNSKSVKFTDEEGADRTLYLRLQREINAFEERFERMSSNLNPGMIRDFILILRNVLGNKDRSVNADREIELKNTSTHEMDENEQSRSPRPIQSILKNSSYSEIQDNEEESQFNSNIITSSPTARFGSPETPPPRAPLNWPRIIAMIKSFNFNDQMRGVVAIRKAINIKDPSSFEPLLNSAIIPRLVDFLSDSSKLDLQIEASWTLTNIAAGPSKFTNTVVNADAIPHLIELLSSKCIELCEQAIWALANIIGDGPDLRDFVLQHGVLEPLLTLLQKDSSKRMSKHTIVWTLANICRDVEESQFAADILENCLPALIPLIEHGNPSILMDVLDILRPLASDRSKDDCTQEARIEYIIKAGLIPALTSLLDYDNHKILVAVLRVLGDILTVSDELAEIILHYRVLDYFPSLLSLQKEKVVKAALFFLSNVAAGTKEQIQAIFDAKLLPLIVHHMNKGKVNIQRDAAWTTRNIILAGDREHVNLLVYKFDVVKSYINLFKNRDKETTLVVLESMQCLITKFSTKDKNDDIMQLIMDGWQDIERLQTHPQKDIAKLARFIVENLNLHGETESDTYVSQAIEDDDDESDDSSYKFLRR